MGDPIYVRIKIINDSDFDVEFSPAIDGCTGSGTLSLTTAAGQWMIPRTELREISCVTSRRSVLRPHSRITNFNETSSGFQLVPEHSTLNFQRAYIRSRRVTLLRAQ